MSIYNRSEVPSGRRRSDTELKPSFVLTGSYKRTLADQIAKMVKYELQGNYHVADTDSLLTKILGLPDEPIEDIYRKLVDDKVYYQGSWTGLPQNVTKEDGLYAPFTKVVNAINSKSNPTTDQGVKNYWLDRHSTSPLSRDKETAAVRPDVVSVLGEMSTLEKMAKLEKSIGDLKEKTTDKPPTDLNKAKKDLEQMLETWWLRVHVPVEIKVGKKKADFIDAVTQLFGYMRQLFREQLDRRFVLGLAFCDTKLSVWLCDRSGLLGTMTPFNVHKEPRKFIRVISALSLLTPARLGWDPTMRLYLPLRNPPFIHSYDSGVTIDDYLDTAYKTQWAIEMPSRDGKGREIFITVRALSVARAEIMCGRGTVVWHVIKYVDPKTHGNQNTPKNYVLKQCWRPRDANSEGFFFEKAGLGLGSEHIAQIFSVEDVMVDDAVDDTLKTIRCDVKHTSSLNLSDSLLGKRARDEETEAGLFMTTTNSDIQRFISGGANGPPKPRVFTRLVMETYGWPIKYFKDIPELFRVIIDAIRAHRFLYYRGILHRDVSLGNILICPNGADVEMTTGCLIDLDHAKIDLKYADKEKIVSGPEPLTAKLDERIKKARPAMSSMIRDDFHPAGIDEEALFALLIQFETKLDALTYVDYICKQKSSLRRDQPLTCDDLDLASQIDTPPDFSDHIPRPGKRTGTLPFMSAEVLGDNVYPGSKTREEVVHDSIHDMESFMWVVIYLCLTRKGPGGLRRDELAPDVRLEEEEIKSLHNIVYCFFDAEDEADLIRNKKSLFKRPEDMQTFIIHHFSPYFEPLKPVITEWWRILQRGYRFSQWGDIHNQFLAVLIKAMDALEPPSSTVDDASAAELNRRREALKSAGNVATTMGSSSTLAWDNSPKKVTGSVSHYNAEAALTEQPSPSPSPSPSPVRPTKRGRIPSRE